MTVGIDGTLKDKSELQYFTNTFGPLLEPRTLAEAEADGEMHGEFQTFQNWMVFY